MSPLRKWNVYLCVCVCGVGVCMCVSVCAELAQAVVDVGAVPSLVLCIQEPELALKRIAASALSDIAKHSPEVRSECIYRWMDGYCKGGGGGGDTKENMYAGKYKVG